MMTMESPVPQSSSSSNEAGSKMTFESPESPSPYKDDDGSFKSHEATPHTINGVRTVLTTP